MRVTFTSIGASRMNEVTVNFLYNKIQRIVDYILFHLQYSRV